MTLAQRINSLAQITANADKELHIWLSGGASDLTGLSTTAKTNLVAAINEVLGLVEDLSAGAAGIDDAATATTSTWSSSKTDDEIDARVQAAVADLLGGAGPTADTLAEILALVQSGDAADQDAISVLNQLVGTKANASDVYTRAQIGDPETDFVATYTAGRA